jgi:hypothetical protein
MVQLILESIVRWPTDIGKAMFDAFMRFEVQYLECIDDVTAGSCALTVLLQDDTLHVANCGDCRAVLYKVRARYIGPISYAPSSSSAPSRPV